MATNPLIALTRTTPDVAPIFRAFNNERQRGKSNRRADRQEARAQEAHELNVDELNRKIDERGARKAAEESTRDQLIIQAQLKDGNVSGARSHLQDRIERLNAQGRNSRDSMEQLQLLDIDPKAFAADVDREIAIAERLGIVPDNSFTLKAGETKFGADNQVLARGPEKSDVKSAARLAQDKELIALRSANDPIRALSGQIAAQRLETAKLQAQKLQGELDDRTREITKENADKALGDAKQAEFTNEALVLTGDLLTEEGRKAVSAAAGPLGSRTPTLSDATADAEIKLNRLAAMMTKDNLDLLSGILSDTDMKLLRDISAGGLDLRGSDEGVIEELERIDDKLSKAAGLMGASNRETPSHVLEFDAQGNLVQ